MDKLQEIIKQLKFICSQEGLAISPDTILEQSVDIYLSKKISESNKEIQSMKNKTNNEITPKQKAFLIKINKYKEGMTKQEAFSIIQGLSKNKERLNTNFQNY